MLTDFNRLHEESELAVRSRDPMRKWGVKRRAGVVGCGAVPRGILKEKKLDRNTKPSTPIPRA